MKKKEYSSELASIVDQSLTDENWHYSFDSEAGIFNFAVSMESKLRWIRYIIHVSSDYIIVHGICPIGADPRDSEVMVQIAEFICRANYGLKNGSFECDFRDGEIRFKSFIDCDSVLPSTEVVKDSIYCVAAAYKMYGDGITSIIFAGATAKEVITKCESDLIERLQRMLSEAGDNTDSSDLSSMIASLAECFGNADYGGEDSGDDTDSSEDETETFADDTGSSGGEAEPLIDLFD